MKELRSKHLMCVICCIQVVRLCELFSSWSHDIKKTIQDKFPFLLNIYLLISIMWALFQVCITLWHYAVLVFETEELFSWLMAFAVSQRSLCCFSSFKPVLNGDKLHSFKGTFIKKRVQCRCCHFFLKKEEKRGKKIASRIMAFHQPINFTCD